VIDVPRIVRDKALAAGALAWLDGLPELVAGLEREWAIVVGRPFGDATEAFVAEATLADGTAAVLKLLVGPEEAAERELAVLRFVDGDGCARLLRVDETRGALLLERLARPLAELGLPLDEHDAILCATAARVWRPAPDRGLPSGAEKARRLARYVATAWERLGRPCSERAVQHALDAAERRAAAHDDERAVLLHGDVHQWNALEASGGGFKLIDPDGLLAEAEYDVASLMREDPRRLLDGDPDGLLRRDPHERARRLARLTGLDAAAISDWSAVDRVSTGLRCTAIELQPVGRDLLELADRVARSEARHEP
jgi:streptomycin 6-kinase